MTDHHDPLAHSPLQGRQAGILLHPTSLPGPWSCGDLGAEAYRFVDFLAAAGQRVWQLLPLGPTHDDGSPYQALSAYAGNPELISVERLAEWGWLDGSQIRPGKVSKTELLGQVHAAFTSGGIDAGVWAEYEAFTAAQADWLEDYALFRVIKSAHEGRPWPQWPAALRNRKSKALAAVREDHAEALALIRFEQFVFHRQWEELKHYANQRAVGMFGDLPIFVAHDSADVWARRECFLLDDTGWPSVVAGVPPDYFSATGQRWGNPHYDWEFMEEDGFAWWLRRMEHQLTLYDLVRIDHFRGFEAYWEVPAHEATAMNGRWVKAPGERLFELLRDEFDPLPVVAEDLGIITPEVEALRDDFSLPGMKILQFAFDSGSTNPYLPHNYPVNSVVYTGTHDNDTTVGWFHQIHPGLQGHVLEFLGGPHEPMPWPLIRSAYASVARLAMIPLQDALELGGEHRMNTPGTSDGNWSWRFDWSQFPEGLAERLARLVDLYGR